MPMLNIIEEIAPYHSVLLNETFDALRDAMRHGRIQYADGVFSGELSAVISRALRKLGARFDKRSKVYRLAANLVPGWVISDAISYKMKAKAAHDAVLRVLDETQNNLDRLIKDRPINATQSINHIEDGFKKAAERIRVPPRLSPEAKAGLLREYSNNMDLWIDKFCREEIQDLRQRVQANALQGYRFDRLITSIKNRYSVSENKAAFLARQETSLFLASFRKYRFLEGGVRRYRWSTAHDKRVRHDHRKLEGTVWAYDNPPITDDETGARNNPGQDYNCRCVDIPVLDGLDR